MFQNFAQLHKAMKEILETFLKDGEIDSIYPKYSESDLVEALDTCLSKKYLTGVSYQVGSDEEVEISIFNPHVTVSGKEFLSGN